MADSVLLGVGQFGIAAAGGVLGGGAVGQAHTGGHKQRVVAKAVGAGLGEADGAGALSCHFQCAAIGQHKADGRDKLGGALPCRDVGHLVQQLSVIGGVIAVVIVAVILCRSRHIKLGAMMDLVVMGLLIGQAIGRWGNFMNREAFGSETTLPWRMQLTTTAGELVEVHPTFLYESLWNLIGLLLIIFVVSKARRFDGENTCFYFLWYGVGRFWIEGLRTDSLYLFSTGIRVSQLVAAVSFIAAAGAIAFVLLKKKPKPENLFVNRIHESPDTQDEKPDEM